MRIDEFDYHLPEELIAQTPLKNRTESRLMVVDKTNKTLEHKHFGDILDYLGEGDVLVLNDTKVIPSRIYGHKEDTDIEPIGRFADGTVIGVKQHGNQRKPQKHAAQLDAPKIRALPKEQALHQREYKHRPEQQLHVLPGRFIDPRKRCDPHSLSQPIVQEMQKRASE